MPIEALFRDRAQAGQVLARALKDVVGDSQPLVLALPRGGVPVAFEVARQLDGDLDILLVRKLGAPGEEELAIGAISSGDVQVLNDGLIEQLRVSPADLNRAIARERREIERRERIYRQGRPALPVERRTAILVDDGLATGASMMAAASAVRAQNPERLIASAPVGSREACRDLRRVVDELVCLKTPDPFGAVGAWYEDFAQTTDAEVRSLLKRASR
ncbi:MAG TPA: phosphoribosyltransferase family protein [Bryobacteraceae bacterium]|nr:phosphoribosyltransferase family protein [Bryobacteraceae bacterium]